MPSGRVLEPTALGGETPVLALAREGVTLSALVRALASPPEPRAILVEGATPVEMLDAIRAAAIDVWLILRQVPEEPLAAWLRKHRERVRMMVGLVPGSTRLAELLHWLGGLHGDELPVQVALEGLLAGVTDTRAALGEVLAALAGMGHRRVSMSYLPLDARAEAWLYRTLGEEAASVLAQYREGPRVRIPGHGMAQLLPRPRRQRGYAGLLTLAAEHGLAMSISPLSNPDLAGPRPTSSNVRQPSLTEAYLAGGLPRGLESAF